jgi:hypothetical protein
MIDELQQDQSLSSSIINHSSSFPPHHDFFLYSPAGVRWAWLSMDGVGQSNPCLGGTALDH